MRSQQRMLTIPRRTEKVLLLAVIWTEESDLTSSFLSFPPVAFQSNGALPMPCTVDGDAISRCQVSSRGGSVHHGADQ